MCINVFTGDKVRTKCFSKQFTDKLCHGGSYSQVTHAVYGVSRCGPPNTPPNCCPSDSDCTSPVTGDFWNTINRACNDKQICTYIIAEWNLLSKCNATLSDYVSIYYKCSKKGKIMSSIIKIYFVII